MDAYVCDWFRRYNAFEARNPGYSVTREANWQA